MSVEAVIVLGSGRSHFRVIRALRPLFLMDSILLHDVRRLFYITYLYCIEGKFKGRMFW